VAELPSHTLNTLRLPKLILELFGILGNAQAEHTWEVNVKIIELSDGRLQREIQVLHQGLLVDRSISRAWRS